MKNEIESQCHDCKYNKWPNMFKQKCGIECEFKYKGDILKRKVYNVFLEQYKQN